MYFYQEIKRHVLEECLTFMVTTFVIPDSGWDKRDIEPVRWTFCFRNATGKLRTLAIVCRLNKNRIFKNSFILLGILRNLSSAGLEARKKMRDVVGLIDALLYVIRLSLGKPGSDAKVRLCLHKPNVEDYRNENWFIYDIKYLKKYLQSF